MQQQPTNGVPRSEIKTRNKNWNKNTNIRDDAGAMDGWKKQTCTRIQFFQPNPTEPMILSTWTSRGDWKCETWKCAKGKFEINIIIFISFTVNGLQICCQVWNSRTDVINCSVELSELYVFASHVRLFLCIRVFIRRNFSPSLAFQI